MTTTITYTTNLDKLEGLELEVSTARNKLIYLCENYPTNLIAIGQAQKKLKDAVANMATFKLQIDKDIITAA